MLTFLLNLLVIFVFPSLGICLCYIYMTHKSVHVNHLVAWVVLSIFYYFVSTILTFWYLLVFCELEFQLSLQVRSA